jgi:hypothetical protein
MSFSFKLSRWDIFYASLIMNFQQPFLIVFFSLFLIWLSYVNWTLVSEYGLIVRVLTVMVLCIPPIAAVVGLIVLFIFLISFSRNNETMLAEQKWVISDDLIVYETEYSRSEIKWIALKRVVSVGGYAFLYFSQMGACLISRKAFVSQQDWKQFINTCRSKIHKK